MKIKLYFIITFILLVGCSNQKIEEQTSKINNDVTIQDDINEREYSDQSKEDMEQQSQKNFDKRVWMQIDNVTSYDIIDVSNLQNKQVTKLSDEEIMKKLISNKNISNVINEEKNSYLNITPSGEYLILTLPKKNTVYMHHDILKGLQEKINIKDNMIKLGYGTSHSGPVYHVVYSIKKQKVISVSDVKDDADKEYIYDLILDSHFYYVSTLDTIKQINDDGKYDFRNFAYHNYNEDKIAILDFLNQDDSTFRNGKIVRIIFYDLIDEKEITHLDITDNYDIDDVEISQWDSDGAVLITVNYSTYQYNINSNELTLIGKFMYYPHFTMNHKFLVYVKQFSPSGRHSYDGEPYTEKMESGIYARKLETGESFQIYKLDDYCDGISIRTIENLLNVQP